MCQWAVTVFYWSYAQEYKYISLKELLKQTPATKLPIKTNLAILKRMTTLSGQLSLQPMATFTNTV